MLMENNLLSLGVQLGGLTLNGNIVNGTAQSNVILTINDPAVIYDSSGISHSNSFLKVKIGNQFYYLPLYQ